MHGGHPSFRTKKERPWARRPPAANLGRLRWHRQGLRVLAWLIWTCSPLCRATFDVAKRARSAGISRAVGLQRARTLGRLVVAHRDCGPRTLCLSNDGQRGS